MCTLYVNRVLTARNAKRRRMEIIAKNCEPGDVPILRFPSNDSVSCTEQMIKINTASEECRELWDVITHLGLIYVFVHFFRPHRERTGERDTYSFNKLATFGSWRLLSGGGSHEVILSALDQVLGFKDHPFLIARRISRDELA